LIRHQNFSGIKGEIVIAEAVQPVGPLRQRVTHRGFKTKLHWLLFDDGGSSFTLPKIWT
jgi:hypothetical protein